jgi:hypothetical protein
VIYALALPALIWIALRLLLPSGPYSVDQGQHKGSFFPLLIMYSVWSYIVAMVSIFGAVFCHDNGMLWSAGVFVAAAVEALLFSGLLVFFYEGYMHSMAAGKSNYTVSKYALILSLGISSILTFLAAVAGTVAAMRVAR